MSEIVQILPTVALRGMTILPEMVVHFDISRDRSIQAVERAMMEDERIFLITQKNPDMDNPGLDDLYQVGCIARVKQVIKLPKRVMRVLVEGIDRAECFSITKEEPYLEAELVSFEKEDISSIDKAEREGMARALKELFMDYCMENPKINKELAYRIMEISEFDELVAQIAINIPLFYADQQIILEAPNIYERYEALVLLLSDEVEISRVKKDIQEKIKGHIDKNQKEYILREQLKLIREELGEESSFSDADRFAKEVKRLKAPKEVKERIKKEIERFKSSIGSSSESGVIRSYIELLLELPWNKASRDNKDLKNAAKVLDEDHYGLEKVKERMLEFLAVRNLTSKGESPIICLVGPPGTGKTSIARSVAKALNKEYVRICLGGVRDEAEIRGHRKTYVGAMPGRIASGLKVAGVKNPLMLLDEIDKVSADYRGETSSALLEVLDSEQNCKFRDHYVELPIDLSEVLFIATANDMQNIPRPLLDRMEIIEVSSYTENEKEHIAREHLLPKQLARNGLKKKQLTISDEALRSIIHGYTREAGVRQLERKLGEICRKAAREFLEDGKKLIEVNEHNLEDYLGKVLFVTNEAPAGNEVGIVRGLAWTSVGGDTLQIEVNIMPGKGEFVLTGQMGDVMKESAQTGISYIRSISEEYHIDAKFFQKHDIHIHIPEGAVPKDGPSAGITMATAVLSAVTKKPVRSDVAMTGEITLRGRVLPIGGLKEKLLAAKNARLRTVLVPEKNRRDVEDISEEITQGLEIRYVETMKDVLPAALA